MMREPVDLRRAVKEEVGRDLADFTFTPAMQERVRARIHQRPRSRMTWLYPASAAAAVLLILVTSTNLTQKATEQPQVAAESAPTPAPTEAFNAKSANPTTAVPPAEQPAADSTGAGGPATRMDMLGGPGIANTMMVAPALGPQLAAVPAEHLVVTLADGAVTRLDPTGAPVWQVNFPASLKAEQVVAAPNGKLVVGAGAKVLLLGPDGSTLESLQLAEPVRQIAVGSSDRLALIGEQKVYVRQAAGQPPIAIEEMHVGAAAFAEEGLLILATPNGLAAYDANGSRRWLASGDGGPLLVSPDGKAVLWGNTLYDPVSGAQVHALEPSSMMAAGGPGLVRWDGERLSGYEWDGKLSWSWTAPGFIASVLPGDGEQLWLIVDTPEGAKLQGLNGETGRPVGKVQSLPAIPQESILLDGKLYLRLPEGLTLLSLS